MAFYRCSNGGGKCFRLIEGAEIYSLQNDGYPVFENQGGKKLKYTLLSKTTYPAAYYGTRYVNWGISGSNDLTNWTVLESVSRVTDYTYNEEREIDISDYKYIRIGDIYNSTVPAYFSNIRIE